jgi:hypothetical protein
MARMVRASLRVLLLLAAVSAVACGPAVDLTKGLEVAVVNSGWFDLGIVNGQTKLVPSLTFTLKNISDQKLAALQINALFRRMNENDEWGSAFVTAVGSEGLPPGGTTPSITVRSQLGYTGSEQSRQEMLANSHFVDARVEVFAKYAATQWVKVGTFPITRHLLTK